MDQLSKSLWGEEIFYVQGGHPLQCHHLPERHKFRSTNMYKATVNLFNTVGVLINSQLFRKCKLSFKYSKNVVINSKRQ